MKVKMLMKGFLTAFSAASLFAATAFAGPPAVNSQININRPDIRIPKPVVHKVDLEIWGVGSSRGDGSQHCGACNGELARVDAMYYTNLAVGIRDLQPYDHNVKMNATVKVTYFDLTAGRRVTKTANFTLHKGGGEIVTVVNHPLLLKKSAGVTAEVSVNTAVPMIQFRELNPGNNKKTVHEPSCVYVVD